MARQVVWTKIIVEEFIELGNLTKFEEQVLRTRAKGMTITEQAMTFNCSKSTIDRTIAELKKKYDAVQPYSVLLPPRKISKEEIYMDTH
jgi:DNA invertase Pin-like site-specific DNA recombinase